MHDTHVMVAPIRHAEVENGRACQLPPGLQVLHAYTKLNAGSKQVLIMVWNMTENTIFLKKGTACGASCLCNVATPRGSAPSEEAEGVQALKE